MARSEFMSIAIVAIVLAVSFQQAFALECWECNWSSDIRQTNAGFCGDPFKNSTTDQWAYISCPNYENHNVYCRKTIEIVNSSPVISRGCYARPKNASSEVCKDPHPSTIITETCELCNTDGCNTANQFTSTIAFIVTSLMIAHILSV